MNIDNETPVGEMSKEPTPAEVSLWVAAYRYAKEADPERATKIEAALTSRGISMLGENRFCMPGQKPQSSAATGTFELSMFTRDCGAASSQ